MLEIVKDSGFCRGVKNATDTANKSTAKNGQIVYLYGDLANNSHVMNRYREKGFIVTTDTDEIQPKSTVIIRAHGVPQAVCDALQAKNVTIKDCTCVKVKRIHNIVEVAAAVIIIGKKNHPEVIGTRGWCKNNDATIVETEADINGLALDPAADICVVGQTTCKLDWWNHATALIQARFANAKIHNTLCDVVMLRNERARELAARVDMMVVVGDTKSANSTELYDTCKKVCENTLFVSSVEELQGVATACSIGLVGSASAPAEVIDTVYEYLAFAQFFEDAKREIAGQTRNPTFTTTALHDLHNQNTGGKCIRGALIKLGEAISSPTPPANFLQVATAYEIFQTAILIHDDIIDRSETRRGKKTIHVQSYEDMLEQGATPNLAMHYAFSRALCIGDLGLFQANNILANAPIDDATKVRVFQEFSQTQLHTINGEIMDVLLPYEPICPAQNYDEYMSAVYEIYAKKTAAYTLQGPLVMGAVCGGASKQLQEALRELALPLGIAFQIKDDLLGMYASDKTLGKPAIADLQERKQTSIFGYAYKHATAAQRVTLDQLYGKQDATITDLETVRDIFTTTGAAQFAEGEIRELSQQSLNLIAGLPIADEGKTLLRGLVHYLTIRRF